MMLKLIILALMAISASAIPTSSNHVSIVKRSVDHMQNLVIGIQIPMNHQIRNKRQIRYDDNDNTEDSQMCMLRCSNRMREANRQIVDLNSAASVYNFQEPSQQKANFTQVEQACNVMRPVVQCFDQCPQSELKSKLQSSLELLRYICVDRLEDLRQNFRCMRKLDTDARQQCSPRCGQYERQMNQTIQLNQRQYLMSLYNQAELIDMLSGACSYIQCYMRCSIPLTRQVCGRVAAELISSITQKSFVALKTTMEMMNTGNLLPQSCAQLANRETINPDADSVPVNPNPSNAEIEDTDDQDDQQIRNNDQLNQGNNQQIQSNQQIDSVWPNFETNDRPANPRSSNVVRVIIINPEDSTEE